MVAGDGGWIVAVDISDGSATMRVPIIDLHGLESAARGAISMADHTEIHDEENQPSDHAMQRIRELSIRMGNALSIMIAMEDVASSWLKQQ